MSLAQRQNSEAKEGEEAGRAGEPGSFAQTLGHRRAQQTQEDEAGSEARQLPALVSTRRPPRLGRLASRHYSELAPRQQRQHGD
ncbi:unnamed protein product [Lampetra planeri]